MRVACLLSGIHNWIFSLGLGADEAFLLSSRSALVPDLELAVLDLRLDFFLESLPFRDFRPGRMKVTFKSSSSIEEVPSSY
ncbi:hypothetical protein RHMOL_RhmolMtG0009200 (mitochondrion) [Rhododendron molle]|nr:hypothetical protein RHMOL_RhmolMtG0009200 [Rhododendron molle]